MTITNLTLYRAYNGWRIFQQAANLPERFKLERRTIWYTLSSDSIGILAAAFLFF